MANINGVELKKYSYQKKVLKCVVYYNDRKLGMFKFDVRMGSYYVDFDESLLDVPFQSYVKNSNSNMVRNIENYRIANFIMEIANLYELEKKYKKAIRNGAKSLVVVSDDNKMITYYSKNTAEEEIKSDGYTEHIERIKNSHKLADNYKVEIFENEFDFFYLI